MLLLRVLSVIFGIVLACGQFFLIKNSSEKGKGLWVISLITLIFLSIAVLLAVVLIKTDIIMALCLLGGFAITLNIYAVIKFIKLKTGGN